MCVLPRHGDLPPVASLVDHDVVIATHERLTAEDRRGGFGARREGPRAEPSLNGADVHGSCVRACARAPASTPGPTEFQGMPLACRCPYRGRTRTVICRCHWSQPPNYQSPIACVRGGPVFQNAPSHVLTALAQERTLSGAGPGP